MAARLRLELRLPTEQILYACRRVSGALVITCNYYGYGTIGVPSRVHSEGEPVSGCAGLGTVQNFIV